MAKAVKKVKGGTHKLTVKVKGTKAVNSLYKATKKIKSKTHKVTVKTSGTKSLKSLQSHISAVTKKVKSLDSAAKKSYFGKYIAKQAEDAVKSLKGKGNFAKQFESMTKKFDKDLKSMTQKAEKEFNSMWSSIEKSSNAGKTHTLSILSSFSHKFTNDWKSLEGGVRKTFNSFWSNMANTAVRGVNAVIRILNNAIGKIDSVIADFGGSKHAVSKVGLVRYARGTGYFGSAARRAITKPTLAVLNDGHDSPQTGNREGIYDKSTGSLSVVNGTNVPFLLGPQHEVFNATEMRELGVTRHFATGTGYLKKLYERAKHYWNNPTKTGDSLFGKITGLVGAINSLANGMLKSGQKQGTEWWSQLWKMVEDKVEDDGDATLTGLVKAMAKNGHGKIYQWGATGPKEFDCSGLVMYTLKKDFGIDYPHFSGSQYSVSQHISRSEAKPGDLVFWGRNGGIHVGAYAGHNQYYSAYGPNGTHGIGMMPLSSVVGYGKPLFARVRGLKQKDDKHEEVKANTKLQKLIKNQVGKGFWKTISKIADKFGDAGGAGNVKLAGDLTQKSLQLAKALKRADPKATAKGIAALISNAIAESTLNAGVTNGSGATGLWQFLGSRRIGLENYARSHHGSYHNAGIQIDYALHGDSSRALFKELLEGNRSPYSMAYQFSRQWEIGGNDAGHAAHADSLYKLLKDHGYANGGIISSPQLAMVGEGAAPETIIPWDISKRSRAYQLLGTTLAKFKSEDGQSYNYVDQEQRKEEHDFMQAVLLLLRQIAAKSEVADIKLTTPQGRTLWEVVEPFSKAEQRAEMIKLRRGLSGR